MRAKFINEKIGFERGKDPRSKMKIGYGPAKPEYIKDFEKAMEVFGIEISRENLRTSPSAIIWYIVGPGDLPPKISDTIVFLKTKSPNGKTGWSFSGTIQNDEFIKWYDTPYPIIKFIVEAYYADIDEHIEGLKDALKHYEGAKKNIDKWSKKWS